MAADWLPWERYPARFSYFPSVGITAAAVDNTGACRPRPTVSAYRCAMLELRPERQARRVCGCALLVTLLRCKRAAKVRHVVSGGVGKRKRGALGSLALELALERGEVRESAGDLGLGRGLVHAPQQEPSSQQQHRSARRAPGDQPN
eukprot:2351729-Rhodomonas_salina.1